jgi:hypothetical protein
MDFLFRTASWCLIVALAVLAAKVFEPSWSALEGRLRAFSKKKALCCAGFVLTVLILRGAMLAVWEIPKPFVHDEYGYLLQADTFASGRLTNPPHPMAAFFETPYILQQPTYNAKFPPGQGLFLAVGQLLFGHPWFGVWLSCGVLAGLLCWALQGWFPPGWALFGTALVLPLCLFSNWMNSYWGGAVAGIGGALAFGSAPRMRSGSVSSASLLSVGASILALTRPFEGLAVVVPLAVWVLFQKLRPAQWISLLLTGAAGISFLAYYNLQITGDPLRMPYTEYERQYPMTSHFNILPLPPPKEYPQPGIALVDHWERAAWRHAREPRFPLQRMQDLVSRINVFFGSVLVLIPVIVFAPRLLRNRRLRAIRWALGMTLVVSFVEVLYFDHYSAPALAPLLILVVQGFRHLRLWGSHGNARAGVWITRAALMAALLLAIRDPASKLVSGAQLYHPAAGGRELLEQSLEEQLGPHVVLVRHKDLASMEPDWASYPAMELAPVLVEFVHNGANIDRQQVIWANDLGDAQNERLREYYKGRTFWLYEPEVDPDRMHALPPGSAR